MVAKISFGSSLYGALAYNGEKINKEEGKLLATNKIFDDCSGKTSIANALRDFQRYLSPHIRTEKPVVHTASPVRLSAGCLSRPRTAYLQQPIQSNLFLLRPHL